MYIYITQSLFHIPKTYTSIKKKKNSQNKDNKKKSYGFFPQKIGFREEKWIFFICLNDVENEVTWTCVNIKMELV